MSALGQKQTSAHVRVMSALPPTLNWPDQLRRSNSGSFAIFAAIRRALAGCTPGAASTRAFKIDAISLWMSALHGATNPPASELSFSGRASVKRALHCRFDNPTMLSKRTARMGDEGKAAGSAQAPAALL